MTISPDAVDPAADSAEVIAEVTFCCTPPVAPAKTFTVIEQNSPGVKPIPLTLMVFDPGTAVTVPPQGVSAVPTAGGLATTSPAGSVSVKLTLVKFTEFGLLI